MNREILFRGKRTDNGEWVEGFLIGILDPCKEETSYKSWIIHDGVNISGGVVVDPATVGQFINAHYDNKSKMWEDDIIRFCHDEDEYVGIIMKMSVNGCYVKAISRGFIDVNKKQYHTNFRFDKDKNLFLSFYQCRQKTLIGNIHDNPELLNQ